MAEFVFLMGALLDDEPQTGPQQFKAGTALRKAYDMVLSIRQQAQERVGLSGDQERYYWGLYRPHYLVTVHGCGYKLVTTG